MNAPLGIPHHAALKYEPQAVAQRAGSLNFNGPRQIWAPDPIILCNNVGGGEAAYDTTVIVPAPDSRCRIKISVLFIVAAGSAAPDITGPSSIWVAACEADQKGTGGGSGRLIPVTDLEGHQGTPTPIPKDPGLLGYSREFVTAADWIQVVFSTASLATPGTWVLQTRIQPDAVTLDWVEWDQIRRLFLPQNLGGTGSI